MSRGARRAGMWSPSVCLLWCLLKNTKGCLWFWIASGSGEQYWENSITSMMAMDYCHWKCCCLKWHDWALSPRAGQPRGFRQVVALFVLLSVDISWTWVGKHFLRGRVGTLYFDSDPFPPSFSSNNKNVQFLPECILQPSMGWLRSQPQSVNNVPNNYVTVMSPTWES